MTEAQLALLIQVAENQVRLLAVVPPYCDARELRRDLETRIAAVRREAEAADVENGR